MFLHLTTLLDLDQNPIGAVDAQFVGGAFSNTFMVVATDPDRTGPMAVLHSYGPFASDGDARAWAAAHLTPYSAFTVAPLAIPYTDAEGNAGRRKPITHSTTARPARADTVARLLKTYDLPRLRLHRGTRTDASRRGFTARECTHPHLGDVVELIAHGPDDYQRESDHRLMQTVLRHDGPRYEVTDQRTRLLVRRPSDAELHAAADQAAARVAPHLSALTADTPPPAPAETAEAARITFDAVQQAARGTASETARALDEPTAAAEAAHVLFDAVLRAAREVASDDPDDYDLMCAVEDMDAPDALAALRKAFLPSDMIEPVADVLALLDPHTYAPQAG